MKLLGFCLLLVCISFGYSQTEFLCPIENCPGVSRHFGKAIHPVLNIEKQHNGVDLECPTGTSILAAAPGTILQAETIPGYGTVVKIRHAHRIETFYAHLSKLNVKKGQRIRRGDVIAFSGSSGLSSRPHLHYEVIVKGRPVDPNDFLHQ